MFPLELFFWGEYIFSLEVPRTEPQVGATLAGKAVLLATVSTQGLIARPHINLAFARIFPFNSMATLHSVPLIVLPIGAAQWIHIWGGKLSQVMSPLSQINWKLSEIWLILIMCSNCPEHCGWKLKIIYCFFSLYYLNKQTNKKEITVWRLILVRERNQDQDRVPRAKELIQQIFTLTWCHSWG